MDNANAVSEASGVGEAAVIILTRLELDEGNTVAFSRAISPVVVSTIDELNCDKVCSKIGCVDEAAAIVLIRGDRDIGEVVLFRSMIFSAKVFPDSDMGRDNGAEEDNGVDKEEAVLFPPTGFIVAETTGGDIARDNVVSNDEGIDDVVIVAPARVDSDEVSTVIGT